MMKWGNVCKIRMIWLCFLYFLQCLQFQAIIIQESMSTRANLNRNHWNDSMHIFFSPKLSLEGRNLLPQIIDPSFGHRDQNFLTVFKKPIVNIYDKISIKKQKRPAVVIIGQAKQVQKRTQTTQNKRRHISAQLQQQFMKNYRQTINQVHQLQKPYKRKGISYNKIDITKQKQQKQKYYFYIGPGNNCELIQQILGKRPNWIQTNSSLYHLRWQQYRPKYQNNAINKQLFNHLPNHQVISDKVGLVNSLKSYCEKNQEEMFAIIPTCFYFDFANLESCQSEIKRFIQFYFDQMERVNKMGDLSEEQKMKSVCSSPKKTISKTESSKTSNQSTQSPNRTNFRTSKRPQNSPSIQDNTKRKQQIKQLHKVLLSKLKTHYNFVDMSAPRRQSQYLTPIHYEVYGSTSLWLLKPADLNRGRGIHLFRTIQELGDLLKSELTRHEKGSFLVQKYIEKPMLIDSRKFDIRVYSLITQNKQVYFFKEGYIRTSSVTFDVASTNYFTHLTNNAVQKHSKNYGEFQQGNILPLNYLFRQHGLDKKTIYDQIKRKILICTKASFPKIFNFPQKLPNVTSSPTINQNQSNINSSKMKYFQIFGYDFMLDQTGHVWLIQVNTNPCIELSNQWLKSIIPRMLDDAFKLTVDRMFVKSKEVKEVKENTERATVYSVPQYPDEELMWEYLDLRTETNGSPVVSRIG